MAKKTIKFGYIKSEEFIEDVGSEGECIDGDRSLTRSKRVMQIVTQNDKETFAINRAQKICFVEDSCEVQIQSSEKDELMELLLGKGDRIQKKNREENVPQNPIGFG